MSEFKARGRKRQDGRTVVGLVMPCDLATWLRNESVARRQAMSQLVQRLLEEERERQVQEQEATG
jgi:hypothetical protein